MLGIPAALCSVLLTAGTHALECRVEYLHIVGGVRYEDTETRGAFLVGPAQATCSGEGHAARVTMKDLGAVICRAEVDLFSDDFENGSTSAWTSVVP